MSDQCCSKAAPPPSEMGAETPCCPAPEKEQTLWKLLQRLRSVWSLIVLIPLLVGLLDSARFAEVISIAASALLQTTPYILVAILLLAYLKASSAESLVARAFEGRENRMIIFAALLGGLAPFCSCQVIPFIAGLLSLGSPLPAVMAFWLSSPLIDPPTLMITAGVLGWKFAVGKAVAAVFLGLFGGFGIKLMMATRDFRTPLRNNRFASSGSFAQGFTGQPVWRFWAEKDRRQNFVEQGGENALFLFKWLTLAYLLEALLLLYVPAERVGSIVGGDGLGSIALGALVGMPAYLNSYAAPPLVAGMMEHGMTAGSAMAFMVAGAISSIPAMTAVWSLVKKQVFTAYMVFGVGGAMIFGFLFSMIV